MGTELLFKCSKLQVSTPTRPQSTVQQADFSPVHGFFSLELPVSSPQSASHLSAHPAAPPRQQHSPRGLSGAADCVIAPPRQQLTPRGSSGAADCVVAPPRQ